MKRLIIFLIIIALLLGGCSWIDQLQAWKNSNTNNNTSDDSKSQTNIDEPLVKNNNQTTDENTPTTIGDTIEVTLYFSNADGTGLVAEKREIPKQEGLARATISNLIDGPQNTDLLPTLPAATILEDININNGLCTVDFSGELRDNLGGGVMAEQLAVYSIVKTLSQFTSVDSVRILVDGQAVESLAGHIDTSDAIAVQTVE